MKRVKTYKISMEIIDKELEHLIKSLEKSGGIAKVCCDL